MFKLLELGDPEWVGRIMGLGPVKRDLHLDQRMLAPYATTLKNRAFLALTTSEDGYIVEPVLLTPEGYCRHAFNFGGPMASLSTLNSCEHTESLDHWATSQGAISKYCTLIPSLVQDQLRLLSSSDINPEYKKQSVVVDLTDQKVRGTTRRMAVKAQVAGVTVKSYDPDTYLETFYNMYMATMDRVGAEEHWNFPFKWFQVFNRFVKPQLLMAELKGELEAGCLVVYSQQYPVAYYYLAGTFNKFPSLGVNHMLVLAACDFVKAIGIRYLYLGGGLSGSEDDGLFIFKSGFSKDRLPVYVYSKSYVKETRLVN